MTNTKHLKYFTATVIILFTFILASCALHTTQSSAYDEDLTSDNQLIHKRLFAPNGKPQSALRQLLKATHVTISPTDTIPQIHEKIVAAAWKSPSGSTERPDMRLPEALKKQAHQIIHIIDHDLHMNRAVYPKPKMHFDGALYLGAAFTRIVTRIEFYNQLVDKGLLPKDLKMYVLTGDRKASPEKFGESPEAFLAFARKQTGNKDLHIDPKDLPTNELEIIQFVFKYIPPRASAVEYVYSAKDPTHTRATTDSTMVSFLEKVEDGGTFVAISNQPYVDYQQSVLALRIAKLGRNDVKVYTVGDSDTEEAKEARNSDNYAAILLDGLGKIIGNLAELEKLKP